MKVSEALLGFTVQDGTSTPASVLVSAALSMALVTLALAATGETGRALLLRVALWRERSPARCREQHRYCHSSVCLP